MVDPATIKPLFIKAVKEEWDSWRKLSESSRDREEEKVSDPRSVFWVLGEE